MVDVADERYVQQCCSEQPRFGVEGSKVSVYCMGHAEDIMVDVVSEHCRAAGLQHTAQVRHGGQQGRRILQHEEGHMVGVVYKRCTQHNCSKRRRFGLAGAKVGVYCKEHADNGMAIARYSAAKYCPVSGWRAARSVFVA